MEIEIDRGRERERGLQDLRSNGREDGGQRVARGDWPRTGFLGDEG